MFRSEYSAPAVIVFLLLVSVGISVTITGSHILCHTFHKQLYSFQLDKKGDYFFSLLHDLLVDIEGIKISADIMWVLSS